MPKPNYMYAICKSLSRLVRKSLQGFVLDASLTNTMKLPDMGNLQIYLVWSTTRKDFIEALIFRTLDRDSKYYLCSLRRGKDESTGDLLQRVMATAEGEKAVARHQNKFLEKLGILCYKHQSHRP